MFTLRIFTRGLAAGFVLAVAAAFVAVTAAGAQELQEGKNYFRFKAPLPVETGRKIEVIEFFSYGCPHCADLEPILLSIYRNAFDPSNPNFWGYAPANKATQLSVEAALVASLSAISMVARSDPRDLPVLPGIPDQHGPAVVRRPIDH